MICTSLERLWCPIRFGIRYGKSTFFCTVERRQESSATSGFGFGCEGGGGGGGGFGAGALQGGGGRGFGFRVALAKCVPARASPPELEELSAEMLLEQVGTSPTCLPRRPRLAARPAPRPAPHLAFQLAILVLLVDLLQPKTQQL